MCWHTADLGILNQKLVSPSDMMISRTYMVLVVLVSMGIAPLCELSAVPSIVVEVIP